ncbi:MAG: hypothetical protein JW966_07100 [Anaerolineae bacterium]|nr:hypothetical protein [Anaerolineae bacterium]
MRCLGRITGLGFVFLFIVIFPCSMWTFNTQRIALNSDTYKSLFTDEGFYKDLIPDVLPAFADEIDGDELPPGELLLTPVIDSLDERDWEDIAVALVPAPWLKDEVESNMDAFFGWLERDRDDLVLVFHTQTLRDRLMGPPGDEAIQHIMAALPACDPEEDRQFEEFSRGGDVEFPGCRPQPTELQRDLFGMLMRAKNRIADNLPEEIDVVEEVEIKSAEHSETGERLFTRGDLDQFRSTVLLWRRLLILAFTVPLAMLSMVVITAVRSSKLFFRWVGWPVLLGSLFTLAPLVLLPFILPDLRVESADRVEEGFATGGELLANIIGNGMLRLIIGEFTLPVLQEGAVLIVIGFVFLVLSVLLPDPDAPLEEAPSTVSGVPVYQTPSGQVILAQQVVQPDAPTQFDDVGPSERTPPPAHTPSPERVPPPDHTPSESDWLQGDER